MSSAPVFSPLLVSARALVNKLVATEALVAPFVTVVFERVKMLIHCAGRGRSGPKERSRTRLTTPSYSTSRSCKLRPIINKASIDDPSLFLARPFVPLSNAFTLSFLRAVSSNPLLIGAISSKQRSNHEGSPNLSSHHHLYLDRPHEDQWIARSSRHRASREGRRDQAGRSLECSARLY